MKKVAFVLITLILISCSQSGQSGLSTEGPAITGEMIAFLLSEKPPNIDTGLFLYRNPTTRPVVERFYAGVTSDAVVAKAILAAAEANDIPLPLAFSLAWVESEYRIRAVNRNAGSLDRGLFQLNSRSFPQLKEEEFFNPATNAWHGLAHLRFCLKEGENEVVALAMYNAGAQQVRRGTPYTTLNYVARTLEYRQGIEVSFQALIQDSGKIANLGAAPPEDS
jgi:soluble lytic murein transglycosylase-like protein